MIHTNYGSAQYGQMLWMHVPNFYPAKMQKMYLDTMKLQIKSVEDRRDILLNHPGVTLWTTTINIVQH